MAYAYYRFNVDGGISPTALSKIEALDGFVAIDEDYAGSGHDILYVRDLDTAKQVYPILVKNAGKDAVIAYHITEVSLD
jgi:hypothetical protein